METKVRVTGRNPVPRVINIKQGTLAADRVIFTLDTAFTSAAKCAVAGDIYRQEAEFEGKAVIWNISEEFTRRKGSFDIQLEITDRGRIWKSDVMVLIVSESTSGNKPVAKSGNMFGDITMCLEGTRDNGIYGKYTEVI